MKTKWFERDSLAFTGGIALIGVLFAWSLYRDAAKGIQAITDAPSVWNVLLFGLAAVIAVPFVLLLIVAPFLVLFRIKKK